MFCCGHTRPRPAGTEHFEKHFPVKGHPVVCIHNIGDGRIEVKSSKNQEVIVAGTAASKKVSLETEAPVIASTYRRSWWIPARQPSELEVNFQLTVPEETELELKTQTGLIYVEQVIGDMTLQSVAGDIHLKEVSGYIVVRTMHGSLVCAQCAGKLDFNSVSGNAQLLAARADQRESVHHIGKHSLRRRFHSHRHLHHAQRQGHRRSPLLRATIPSI